MKPWLLALLVGLTAIGGAVVFVPPQSRAEIPQFRESDCRQPPVVPVAAIRVERSLFVHDLETLGDAGGPFSLRKTLDIIAAQAAAAGVPDVDGERLFAALWKTQRDATPVNGFPYAARPGEAAQADTPAVEMGKYVPVALVNRLDLAGDRWQDCGEYRIVYARVPGGESTIILEAVLPNPTPGCRSGCLPVIRFWHGLKGTDDAAFRATALANFYYAGLPGFRPVVHLDHYAALDPRLTAWGFRGGQIRTNSRLHEDPWSLREFHLLLACGSAPCTLTVVRSALPQTPYGELWDGGVAAGDGPFAERARDFQSALLVDAGAPGSAVGALASPVLNEIDFPLAARFTTGQSLTARRKVDNYVDVFTRGSPEGFRSQLEAATPPGLTAKNLVARATALSCAGCHAPQRFELQKDGQSSIGPAALPDGRVIKHWPGSIQFVHVSPEIDGGSYEISEALSIAFLPDRAKNLAYQLSQPECGCTAAADGGAPSGPTARLGDDLQAHAVPLDLPAEVRSDPRRVQAEHEEAVRKLLAKQRRRRSSSGSHRVH